MKNFAFAPLAILIIFLSLNQVFAVENTYSIKGNIIDHATNNRIENANVFLSKTTFNTTSNKSGEYEMDNILPGNYDMVFHAEGYEKLIVNVNISGTRVIEIDAFLLKESIDKSKTKVSETVYSDEWKQNLQQFRTIFLGSGKNADSSEILNPDVLSFSMDKQNRFTVTADEDLHIINHALGYELFVTIQSFSWNLDSNTGYFLNLVRMNELEVGAPEEISQWAINRAKTYDESLRKFLYTLTQNSPTPGFAYTYNVPNRSSDQSTNDLYTASSSIFSSYAVKARGPQSGRFIKITDPDAIEDVFPDKEFSDIHLFEIRSNYENIAVLPDYRPGTSSAVWNNYLPRWNDHQGNIPNPESERLSFIGHTGDGDHLQYLAVDSYGNLLNPLDIVVSGYWAQDRLADFLPFNYRPEKQNLAAM
jgi:hypothetical protein